MNLACTSASSDWAAAAILLGALAFLAFLFWLVVTKS